MTLGATSSFALAKRLAPFLRFSYQYTFPSQIIAFVDFAILSISVQLLHSPFIFRSIT